MIGSRYWNQEEQLRVASEFCHSETLNIHSASLGAAGSLMGCLQAFESSLSSAHHETPCGSGPNSKLHILSARTSFDHSFAIVGMFDISETQTDIWEMKVHTQFISGNFV